jgi:hypothetical protein
VGPGYTKYCYAVGAGQHFAGKLLLILLNAATKVASYLSVPLGGSWESTDWSAMSQWHDSGSYLLKSYYSTDAAHFTDTNYTSYISTVVGDSTAVKKANGVVLNKYTPTFSSGGALTMPLTTPFKYLLYDQIALTDLGTTPGDMEVSGTLVSSGVNDLGYTEFPGCTKPSYILPLGMHQDAISFYVTEVTTAKYSDTEITGGSGEKIRKTEFTYNVDASMSVLNVDTQAVIEKIPFKSGINKHSLITTTRYTDPPFTTPVPPTVIVEDINMNFVTPLRMNTLFKVFLYIKSTSLSNRVFTAGVLSSGGLTKTHDLYIMYNGVEHLVATGVIHDVNFKFPGEEIVVKSNV